MSDNDTILVFDNNGKVMGFDTVAAVEEPILDLDELDDATWDDQASLSTLFPL